MRRVLIARSCAKACELRTLGRTEHTVERMETRIEQIRGNIVRDEACSKLNGENEEKEEM